MPRFAVTPPASGREIASLAASATVALALITLASGASSALPVGLSVAAGVLGVLAAVLVTAYAIFVRSRLAVLEVGRETVRLRTMTVTRPTGRAGLLRWRGRSWTILDISGGGDRIRIGCPGKSRGAPEPEPSADDPALDGIATLDELLELTQAVEQPDLALPPVPDLPQAGGRAGQRAAVWMLGLIAGGVAVGVVLPRLVGSSIQHALGPVLVVAGISIAVVLSLAPGTSRSRGRLPDQPIPATHRLVPSIETGQSNGPTFWGVLFGVLAKVAIAVLVPVILFGPSYQVMKAFERHVDVPGCQSTCRTHGLTFDSYSWGKTGNSCVCRPADHPENWRVFRERYNVLGGDSWGAAVLNFVIRAAAAVGTFCLGLALIVFVLVRLKRARSR